MYLEFVRQSEGCVPHPDNEEEGKEGGEGDMGICQETQVIECVERTQEEEEDDDNPIVGSVIIKPPLCVI